jgi:hypothetical protein
LRRSRRSPAVICRAIWLGPASLFGRFSASLFGISPRLTHCRSRRKPGRGLHIAAREARPTTSASVRSIALRASSRNGKGDGPGSSRPGTGTDPAQAPPRGGRLPPSRDERRLLKLNADKENRRTLPTLEQFLGRLAVPNRDQVIPTGTAVGCENLVVGAA